jgi:hypothetical protein
MGIELKPADIAARAVVHPGKLIPGIPRFVFTTPLGWVLDEAPGALCVLRLPREVDGFWVNAILSHDKVARAVDFESAAKASFARLKRTSPDVKANGERLVRFGDQVMYLRGVELTAGEGRRLGQFHAMFFAPVHEAGKTVDFFQFVLTAPVGAMDGLTKPFIECLSTFRFT